MTCTAEDIKQLFADFPREDIHWRAQSLTADGSKAMALAYLDARDVMDRLDQVCGAGNWQDRYEFHGTRTICYLSIRIDGEWITKADGAGDSDVEAEKGAISDALKRAAVKWGIGRYLYDLPAPWVPCEFYERNNKKYWKRWKADPWQFVKGSDAPKASSAMMKRGLEEMDGDLADCATVQAVVKCAGGWKTRMESEGWSADFVDIASGKFNARKAELKAAREDDPTVDAIQNEFPGARIVSDSHQRPLDA
jgi:hypothetical protein